MQTLTKLLLGLVIFAGLIYAQAIGQEGGAHDGTVVSAAEGQLVMKDEQGRQHSHAVDAKVKITVNGKMGKLEDLTPGMQIHVTMDKDYNLLTITTKDSEK